MTIFLQAKLTGPDAENRLDSDWYHPGQIHEFGMRQHTFSKKITIFKTRGNNNEIVDSRFTYPNLGAFLLDWTGLDNVTVEVF